MANALTLRIQKADCWNCFLPLTAPVWCAGGSVTTATATTGTLRRAMAYQRQWQGDPGNDGLAFSHSSVFGILSSFLFHTSI